VLQVGLDGFVLFVELGEVGHDVFYDVGVGKGVDFGFSFSVCWDAAQTSQSINSINIHRTTPTYSLPTTPSKCQRRINLILNPDQRIQHHRTRLIQI